MDKPFDHKERAEALRVVLDILNDPRRMPRKLERARLIQSMREVLESLDGDSDRDNGGGDRCVDQIGRGA